MANEPDARPVQEDSSPSHPHGEHKHVHGFVEPTLVTTQRGIWAIQWSFLGLGLTALFQIFIVYWSGSVALLADTIHNFGDAATALPLWVAFRLVRLKPSKRFPYGYGRVEDLAGVAVVLVILFSAVVAGYESAQRLLHPQRVEYLWAVATASLIGFLGNEAVALLRIKVGKEIRSAALVADGYHARVDGLTSLSVLFGAMGVWLGYPLADPIVGLLITAAILWIVWESSRAVFTRMLDGVEPELLDQIRHIVSHTPGVGEVAEVRARWIGHRLQAEVNIAVGAGLSVAQAHEVAKEAHHQLLHHLPYLSAATIHIDPLGESGERYHRLVPGP